MNLLLTRHQESLKFQAQLNGCEVKQQRYSSMSEIDSYFQALSKRNGNQSQRTAV